MDEQRGPRVREPDPTDELFLWRWLREQYPCPTCGGFAHQKADNIFGMKECADCHPSRPGVRHPEDDRIYEGTWNA